MEVKTMVLDGIEYVLIPKDVFEKSIGVEVSEPKQEEPILSDFQTPEIIQEATKEEQRQSIIVDSVSGVGKAIGKDYGYKQRLDKRQLLPEDVMVTKSNFQNMPETPEIARNDSGNRFPPGKWGFYGPGAERDLG